MAGTQVIVLLRQGYQAVKQCRQLGRMSSLTLAFAEWLPCSITLFARSGALRRPWSTASVIVTSRWNSPAGCRWVAKTRSAWLFCRLERGGESGINWRASAPAFGCSSSSSPHPACPGQSLPSSETKRV